jgi:hypothetical protein
LAKVNEWENFDSGQGKGNSGKFATYFAYANWLEKMAEEHNVQPFYLLRQLWRLESIGEVETPEMIIREAKLGKTRLSQNLRFIYDRGERKENL